MKLVLLCVFAAGCVEWPHTAGPTPGLGCVQITVAGRAAHYWKHEREVPRGRFADALADVPAARAKAERSRRSSHLAIGLLTTGVAAIVAGGVVLGIAFSVRDSQKIDVEAPSLALMATGGAIGTIGMAAAAAVADNQQHEAVVIYNREADAHGCPDPSP
jgi:hypothetical protein